LIPTRHSLLSRLKNWDDQESWNDFFNTYWRLVYGVALKAGLSEQEAEEVVQETVITVARRIPEFKYDPAVCSFKTWLMNLTRWRIVDQLRKRKSGHARFHTGGDEPNALDIEQIPDPSSLDWDAVWDTEWKRHVLEVATERVRRRVNPEHFQMFTLCAFKDWPVRKVAQKLKARVSQVYLAKHRVGLLIRKEVRALNKQDRIKHLLDGAARWPAGLA
jgi:RNA polymerase sigma-70 factor (ECF subfamily)